MQDRRSEFWPGLFVKKWLSFRQTGDDFDKDTDSSADELSESERFEDDVDLETFGGTRDLIELDSCIQSLPIEDSAQKNFLSRSQSETPYDHYIVNKQYKIAVGTWNVGGLLPPDDLDLDGFLDTSDPADIYVLGFQEIVPLNTNNVLCVEDESPTIIWDGLIRHSLNYRMNCCKEPLRSFSAPPSLWHNENVVNNVPEVSDVECLLETVSNEETLESSHLLKQLPNSSDSQWLKNSNARHVDEPICCSTKNVKVAEDWPCAAAMQGDGVTDSATLVARPHPSSMHSSHRYMRVASKQMVGVFITIWVRSDLRRYVHNIKVCVVGCGILNFLGNKGAVSISMYLHQTSFCFVCTHLQSGHKEGDEIRRNNDVDEILRRTSFPRLVRISGVQLPETILAHDRVIWLGDLNYRIDLPDKETWILVNQCDWKSLIQRDQLKIERDAGRVFEGWHEETILFPPTYKYVLDSDQYFGEDSKPGDKRRTPAWCDRILWSGKGLRQINYLMIESQLSDHRPVTGKFIADVDAVSEQKIKIARRLANNTDVNMEGHLPRLYPINVIQNMSGNWVPSRKCICTILVANPSAANPSIVKGGSSLGSKQVLDILGKEMFTMKIDNVSCGSNTPQSMLLQEQALLPLLGKSLDFLQVFSSVTDRDDSGGISQHILQAA